VRQSEGALSNNKIYGQFFFVEISVSGINYLDLLKYWLLTQLNEDFGENFILQQDRMLPHYHNAVTRFLNENLPR
jgi:hypothetical protein